MKNNNNEHQSFLQKIINTFKSILHFITQFFSSASSPAPTENENKAATMAMKDLSQGFQHKDNNASRKEAMPTQNKPIPSNQEFVLATAKNTNTRLKQVTNRTAQLEEQAKAFADATKLLKEQQDASLLFHFLFSKNNTLQYSYLPIYP